MSNKKMLRITDITVSYDGVDVLKNVSLTAASGDCVRLTGPSGSGKTTLMLAASGIVKPRLGRVECGFRRIGFVFQDERLLPWLTAQENVAFALSGICPDSEAVSRAQAVLERVGLEGHFGKYPSELSGGMVKRVNLARALAVDPELLFLDEAFACMEAPLAAHCLELVAEWQERRKGCLVAAAHDSTLDGRFPWRTVELP